MREAAKPGGDLPGRRAQGGGRPAAVGCTSALAINLSDAMGRMLIGVDS